MYLVGYIVPPPFIEFSLLARPVLVSGRVIHTIDTPLTAFDLLRVSIDRDITVIDITLKIYAAYVWIQNPAILQFPPKNVTGCWSGIRPPLEHHDPRTWRMNERRFGALSF